MKYCKDCKHHVVIRCHLYPDYCQKIRNVINKSPLPCFEVRHFPHWCGDDAQWFEPKPEPLLKRIIARVKNELRKSGKKP